MALAVAADGSAFRAPARSRQRCVHLRAEEPGTLGRYEPSQGGEWYLVLSHGPVPLNTRNHGAYAGSSSSLRTDVNHATCTTDSRT
eukprot:4856962-Prymnesium_polylepis.2